MEVIYDYLNDYSEDYLAHYGVKGMRWGIRNAETMRKYYGGSRRGLKKASTLAKTGARTTGRIIGSGVRKTGVAISKGVKRAFTTIDEHHDINKEVNRLRKDSASSRRGRKEFDKVRNRTLRSHNPEIIALGLHTLTDRELDNKINRLEREKKVRDMASAQVQSRYDSAKKREDAIKARKERKASGITGRIIDAGISTVKTNATYTGKNAIDKLFGINQFKTNPKDKETSDYEKDAETVVGEILNVETVYDNKKRKALTP